MFTTAKGNKRFIIPKQHCLKFDQDFWYFERLSRSEVWEFRLKLTIQTFLDGERASILLSDVNRRRVASGWSYLPL